MKNNLEASMRTIQTFALATVMLANCSSKGDINGEPARGQDLAPTTQVAPEGAASAARFAVPVDGLPTMGARDALVTLVEFTDYDCVYCARAEHTVNALREKYGKDLRVVVAEHPLPMHTHAREAALAALAMDPRNFEAFHKRLFANPNARSSTEFVQFAIAAGDSQSAFEQAVAGSAPKSALARAELLASTLHVDGTPIFFVNGRKIGGAQPLATFDTVIAEELAYANTMMARGVRRDRVYDAFVDEARKNPAPFEEPKAPAIVWMPEAAKVGGANLLGAATAPLTITLFTDFECPFCQKLDVRLRELIEKRKDVRVVLRHKPLPMHPNARLAAKAAIAAESFGKLEPYAAKLFAHRDALSRDALLTYAQELGMSGAAFAQALDSDATEARLLADEAVAKQLNVRATPTSFVGARRIEGAQSSALFEEALLHPNADK